MYIKDDQWHSCIISPQPGALTTHVSDNQPRQDHSSTLALKSEIERLVSIIDSEVIEPERAQSHLRNELEFQSGGIIPHRVMCPMNTCLTLHDTVSLSTTQKMSHVKTISRTQEIDRALDLLPLHLHLAAANLIKDYLDLEERLATSIGIIKDQKIEDNWYVLQAMTDAWCHQREDQRRIFEEDDWLTIDPLGIYRHRPFYHHSFMQAPQHKSHQAGIQDIYLFALPILCNAMRNHYSIRAQALKVLSHEIAHFVSHRGRNKQNHDWARFYYADKAVIEGVAQHFTHQTLKRLQSDHGSYRRKARDKFHAAYLVYLDTVMPLVNTGSRDPYLIQNEWEMNVNSGDILESFHRFKAGGFDHVQELERLMQAINLIT